jgi:cell division protein FtsN
LVVGLLIGLFLALGVALYVTKVPIPFVNKVPQRTAGQDAAEAEKNKNWDPNSPLYGKSPARPAGPASGAVALPAQGAAAATKPAGPVTTLPEPQARPPAPASTREPAAILGDAAGSKGAPSPATATAPPGPDPFSYFVQAGAYARTEDADQQKARLAMMGMEGRITEREQSGRTVYRVRLGPFEKKAEADTAKEKLGAAGIEGQLVRIQR